MPARISGTQRFRDRLIKKVQQIIIELAQLAKDSIHGEAQYVGVSYLMRRGE